MEISSKRVKKRRHASSYRKKTSPGLLESRRIGRPDSLQKNAESEKEKKLSIQSEAFDGATIKKRAVSSRTMSL